MKKYIFLFIAVCFSNMIYAQSLEYIHVPTQYGNDLQYYEPQYPRTQQIQTKALKVSEYQDPEIIYIIVNARDNGYTISLNVSKYSLGYSWIDVTYGGNVSKCSRLGAVSDPLEKEFMYKAYIDIGTIVYFDL